MQYFIFPLQVIVVFISINYPLVLTFKDKKILDRIGPYQVDARITDPSKDKRTTMIEFLRDKIESSMVIITDKGNYTFNFVHDESKAVQNLEIIDAEKDRSFEVVKTEKDYQVLKGKHSVLVSVTNNKELVFNGKKVKGNEYFSLGPPLFKEEASNKELILY